MEVGFTHPWGWPGGAIAGAQTGPNMFGTDRLVCANPATAGVVGGYLPVLRWTYEETAAGCKPGPLADTHAGGVGQAAWSAADAPVTASRKRKGKAPAATAPTAAISEQAPTGKKPYACSMCPRRFANKTNVARHERTHTGEKPYACSMCPMRFAEKAGRRSEARAHPHRGEALRLLDVPKALRQEERRCGARADPYRREALRLLHVPKTLRQ